MFTLIDCVVAPFDQSHDAPLLAVSVTLLPVQNDAVPAGMIVAGGAGLTVTYCDAVEIQPFAFVTVTV